MINWVRDLAWCWKKACTCCPQITNTWHHTAAVWLKKWQGRWGKFN